MRNIALLCGVFLFLFSYSALASMVSYDFEWTGTGGYTMTGSFSYDDLYADDGVIRDSEVSFLTFSGLLNGAKLFTNNTAFTSSDFNFNFNAIAGEFILGGEIPSDSGQMWDWLGGGSGFGAGSVASSLAIYGQYDGFVDNPVPLVATLSSGPPVPEPSTMLLLGAGLAGLAWYGRKRKKA